MSSFSRVLLVASVLGLGLATLEAQRRLGDSPLDTLGKKVSQAEGLEILNEFRRLGIAGEYRLGFNLEVRPRSGKSWRVPGVLIGTQSEYGPLSRVDIAVEPSDVTDKGELIPAKVKRLLLQNGLFANAVESDSWTEEGKEARLIEPEHYLDGVVGSDFSVFDLLMPFTFWQNSVYEGRTTRRGRPMHVFSLHPPKDSGKLVEQISKVRLFLDVEFKYIDRFEVFDAEETLVRAVWVDAFKLVDGQAVPSLVHVKNMVTKDKALLRIKDASIGIDAPDWVFEIGGMDRSVYGTQVAQLQKVETE
ncbi:outer membrane lipoprotein-sorting protein [Pelagicoccus mobilis]